MQFRFSCAVVLTAVLWSAGAWAYDAGQADSEIERVRALVEAGALPGRALAQAESKAEKARLQEIVRKTLPKRELTEEELPALLDAARRLDEMAREQLKLTLARVEAGASAVNALEEVRAEAELTARQLELAKSRAKLVRELAAMARSEARLEELEEEDLAFLSEGESTFTEDDLLALDNAFYQTFGVPLPISANGPTAFHNALGFDHSGRVDVDVHPDDLAGFFLMDLLDRWDIPYIVFRSAVPGQSSGPHIHIGPPSDHLSPAGTR